MSDIPIITQEIKDEWDTMPHKMRVRLFPYEIFDRYDIYLATKQIWFKTICCEKFDDHPEAAQIMIARRIIKLHQGKIKMEFEDGNWRCVTMY